MILEKIELNAGTVFSGHDKPHESLKPFLKGDRKTSEKCRDGFIIVANGTKFNVLTEKATAKQGVPEDGAGGKQKNPILIVLILIGENPKETFDEQMNNAYTVSGKFCVTDKWNGNSEFPEPLVLH